MTSQDEHTKAVPTGSSSLLARYVFALVATAAGLTATLAIFESGISAEPMYAPLIGAAVLSAWFGGFGPAGLSIAVGWSGAYLLLVAPRGELAFGSADDMTRWWVNLAAAVVIAGLSALLRERHEGASRALVSTQASLGEMESLQQLSMELSVALSSTDVTRVLRDHLPRVVASQGSAVALVDGEQLEVVAGAGIGARFASAGRLDLDGSSLLATAARGNAIARATQRSTLDAVFPGARSVAPSVRSAFAVPIRVGEDEPSGSIAFLFDREGGPTPEAEALARVVADLAGQALERARLYERERESRLALDRILQVAPQFLADEGSVGESVCREARVTFGADYGVLWRVVEDGLRLMCVDPPQPQLDPDLLLPLHEFPQLSEAVRALRTSFVPDVPETTRGSGLAFVQELGIRSSLRTPIVIAGRSELVLSLSWRLVVSEPDPATIAVVRRFADQAGLALEQLERRQAEEEAAARADDTRRLQDVTAALSSAATPGDVSTTCLAHALESIGAEAGFVVLTGPGDSRTVEIVASSGYDDDELEAWRAFGLDDDLPFARAIGTGVPVWALEPDELAAFTTFSEERSTGWFAIPLVTSRGVRGALHVSLRDGRRVTDSQRRWLQTMVAQCGLALERSGLYADEQLSRLRAERLQLMTAQLSNALTPTDVARVVVDEVAEAFQPTAIALASVLDGQTPTLLLDNGDGGDVLAPLLDVVPGTPGGQAFRTRRSVLVDDPLSVRRVFPAAADGIAAIAHETLLFVPLVAARRVNGLFVVSWERPEALAEPDRAIIEALAAQAAQALDRAGRYESEQAIAEQLQRSVLPDSLPRVDGVQLAARYLPGSTRLDVGGDWYDALQLGDDTLALVVGDVVGKGVQAAASMAQLRNAMRAFSLEQLKPSSALTRLNRLSGSALDTSFATLVYVAVEPSTGVCRLSSAGHPPPVVAYPDGRVELAEGGRGVPLGAGPESKYRQATLRLPAGSMLLLYSDGLIERRGASIDDGLAALLAAVASAPKDPDRLLDHVLETVIGSRDREDDIALLVARLLPVAPRPLDLAVPADLGSMSLVRDAMRLWLDGTSLARGDAEGVVLAVWEAVANAVEHAVDPRDETVRLRAELEDSRVRIVVEDTGRWAPPSDRDGRGFGLKLIEGLVSSSAIVQHGSGTTVTLEKRVDSARPGDALEEPDEQQDDDDQRQQSTTDVHALLPSPLTDE